MGNILGKSIFAFLVIFSSFSSTAQHKKISFRDSLDGAFDLGDYVINAHGFVPVPIIITEPALGGFGGGLVPIFLKPRPPFLDTSKKGKTEITPIPPDITGAFGAYTVNNSWATGAFRSGTLVKSRIKYMIGGGYANINMSYYRTLGALGEKEFAFNIKTPAVFVQATKRIGLSNWYGGLKYMFLKTDVEYVGDRLLPPDWVKEKEYSSIVSQLGLVVEFDNRDNVFTPNSGLKFHIDGIWSDNILGSDFDYGRSNYYIYAYKTLSKKVVGGFRLDGQQAYGDPPFFLYPFVDMRGIPANRYSGKADILSEMEFRWDFYRRWSIMLYGGAGKAFNEWKEFGPAAWAYAYGTGFRYLIARKFKLRMGIDVARGPEQFAWYIVFGSTWLK